MTRSTQPGAPAAARAPLSAEARELADQLDAMKQATEEAQRRSEARQAASGRPSMGVVKGSDGIITVTRRDGTTLRIDPKAVPDEDAVQEMVRTALAPPAPPPSARRGPSGEDVAIVSIIFPCLIVIMLIVWRIVATAKRQGPGAAAAAVPAELAGRLARIEQAIEAVAIEVERISESERYSARLLTERLPGVQPQQPPQPARAEAPTANVSR